MRRKILIFSCFVITIVLVWIVLGWINRGVHSASGGIYVPGELVLDVPQFSQADPLWGNERLGSTDATLASEGCAVTSAAMALSSYGYDVDPRRLNTFVQKHNGYTPEGWIYWEKAAEYPPDTVEKAYEDESSFFLIDFNLLRGNPVIARVRFPNGITHFVVIVGKKGFDYLIRDPGKGSKKGIYAMKDLGVPVEAIRYFQRKTKRL